MCGFSIFLILKGIVTFQSQPKMENPTQSFRDKVCASAHIRNAN